MANSKELFNDLTTRVRLDESKDEIHSIVYLILEHSLGLSKTQILGQKEVGSVDHSRLFEVIERINKHEPVQYILGQTEFFGRKFKVTPAVLIPRPETEMLVEIVLAQFSGPISLLDVGTGSGCIAITLALSRNGSSVHAVDKSSEALAVAEENAKQLHAKVNFHHLDIFDDELSVCDLDVVVSNPPYITESERASMSETVVDNEPSMALFVPDDNPLKFYKVIGEQGQRQLKKGGLLIVETNARFGNEVGELFSQQGYRSVRILKDLDGKDRVVMAEL